MDWQVSITDILEACIVTSGCSCNADFVLEKLAYIMGGSPGDVSEEPVTQEKLKKVWAMSCDVGEAQKGWRMNCAVGKTMEGLEKSCDVGEVTKVGE